MKLSYTGQAKNGLANRVNRYGQKFMGVAKDNSWV